MADQTLKSFPGHEGNTHKKTKTDRVSVNYGLTYAQISQEVRGGKKSCIKFIRISFCFHLNFFKKDS